jgi:DNA-binding response OmpR family regulator
MKILVVEDSLPVRLRLIEFIQSYDREHTVLATATVREALNLLHSVGPQLITLDLRLEDGDGTEVLKSSKGQRTPPIVYIFTECANREADCLTLGADGFFDKGGDIGMLLAALESRLQMPSDDHGKGSIT